MRMKHTRWALGALVTTTLSIAQPPPDVPAPPRAPVRGLDDLPPPQRLGARATLLREAVAVVPVVVVVPDARSYIEAVARWTPAARFPVLIDDGSRGGLEDIARFVRAFKPAKVVRWSFKGEGGWPGDPAERRALVEGAVARAWGARAGSTSDELIAHWKQMGLTPPGLVVAGAADPAWAAGLALAAGHAQPIAWVECKQSVGNFLSPEEGAALVSEVNGAAEKTGLKWVAVGDELDAVTLCLNCPAKILVTPGEPLGIGPGGARKDDVQATTDRVGRLPAGQRWAWASQVFGTEARSAYNAMCALFLGIERAWLFDGFPAGAPWDEWDCTEAGRQLENGRIAAVVDDLPRGGRADWRARASEVLDADLALINTRGECFWFDLAPGQGRPGDTPILNRPVIVHMVHSWSLQYPAGVTTVGGRWIEHGAYAYFGSVQEPYLGAFAPTPAVAARLAAGFAWSAACRRDDPVPWRLACIGDALLTRGTTLRRLGAEALALEGAGDVREELAAAVSAAKNAGPKADVFGAVIRLLVLLGEDEKGAALAGALSRDNPDQFTADVAASAMQALARTKDGRWLLGNAFAKLNGKIAEDLALRDALWVGSIGLLGTTQDKELMTQLRRALRDGQQDRDAMDLAPAYARVMGKGAAVEMLREARGTAKDLRRQNEIDRMIETLR